MKIPRIVNAVGYIDDELINDAKKIRKSSFNWAYIAAGIIVLVIGTIIILPMLSHNESVVPKDNDEYFYERGYFYNVENGEFVKYSPGKVIEKEKIGKKITDVYVIAGWKDSNNQWLSTEKLRGEVYTINNISKDIAVALKFIDKGEAVTTTHYYVIINPDAYMTSVEEYSIAPVTPNNNGDEMAGEVIIPE